MASKGWMGQFVDDMSPYTGMSYDDLHKAQDALYDDCEHEVIEKLKQWQPNINVELLKEVLADYIIEPDSSGIRRQKRDKELAERSLSHDCICVTKGKDDGRFTCLVHHDCSTGDCTHQDGVDE